MAFTGFYSFIFFLIMSVVGEVESKDLRKVIVQELRFSVRQRDKAENVSVKNDVHAPDNKIAQALSLDENIRKEQENALLEQYSKQVRKDPFLSEKKIFGPIDVEANPVDGSTADLEDINYKKTIDSNKNNRNNKNMNIKTNGAKVSKLTEVNGKDQNEKDDAEISENNLKDAMKTFEAEALQKIVGGTPSMPANWPWQASIQYFGEDDFWHHFCGGSLIDNRWVVTAAHCVCQLEDYIIRVVLGDYKLSSRTIYREQVINPSRIFMHGFYEESSYYFDIAMIKLAQNAKYTTYVQSINIATTEDYFSESDSCYITGWGNTIGTTDVVYLSDYLMEGRVSVLSETSCQQSYGHIIQDTQICTLGDHASACSGDSGGPLVCHVDNEWKLAGTASWVGSSACSLEYPNVYTRMSSFSEWTESLMNQY